MKAEGERMHRKNCILQHGTGWRWAVSFTPRQLYSCGKCLVPIGYKVGWTDDMENWRFFTLQRLELRSLGRRACSQSLYRLHYRDSQLSEKITETAQSLQWLWDSEWGICELFRAQSNTVRVFPSAVFRPVQNPTYPLKGVAAMYFSADGEAAGAWVSLITSIHYRG
jgi:hypothetical protein